MKATVKTIGSAIEARPLTDTQLKLLGIAGVIKQLEDIDFRFDESWVYDMSAVVENLYCLLKQLHPEIADIQDEFIAECGWGFGERGLYFDEFYTYVDGEWVKDE